MAELSHRALRELISEFGGCDEFFTEMISAPGLLAGGPFEKWYLESGPCPEKLIFQVLGSDIDQLTKAVALLDKRDCLGIDINMGCAAPAITRTGAGVRWMEDIDRAGRLIRAVRRVTKKRLSVKLRLGTKPAALPGAGKTAPGGERGAGGEFSGFGYLADFCRRLEAEGVELITLHPRLADEKFKRRARWEYVSRLRGVLGIPVAGNGDIASAEELARGAPGKAGFAEQAAGPVMAGRLAVRQPWVFANARAFANSEKLGMRSETSSLEKTALCFLELLSRWQPPEFHLSRARRFFRYYCDNFTWAEYLRNRINREETLTGIAGVISGYCRDHEAGS
jgi:tRNA-dihydrouridine synthase